MGVPCFASIHIGEYVVPRCDSRADAYRYMYVFSQGTQQVRIRRDTRLHKAPTEIPLRVYGTIWKVI